MIVEVVGQRGKMYSLKNADGETKKAANGVCRNVKKKEIKHEHFKECLMEDVLMEHMQCRIGHTHHRLETVDKPKRSLCPYNDKRWISKNGTEFESYSFGHKKLKGNFYLFLWNYIILFSENRELEDGQALETM